MTSPSPEPARSPRTQRQRVRPLAPDERRAALIEVTIPLLRVHGMAVSTKQIAQAAGVAEGTIFGVFPDKTSLCLAAVVKAFDPEPILTSIREISKIGDLRVRLEIVARLLLRRFSVNAPLLVVVRSGALPAGPPPELQANRKILVDALAALIEPDRALLRRSPASTARLLLSLVFATGSGTLGDGETLTSKEIVSIVLDGLLIRPQPDHHQERPRADSALT